MTRENLKIQEMKEVYSEFVKGHMLSIGYCAGKCAMVLGTVWGGCSAVKDLCDGKYVSASFKSLVALGAYQLGYKFFLRKDENICKKIRFNKFVLESRFGGESS
jgi:hypothetical protein